MVDIDERVVSMKFDSSDFEKNTKSTMSILDKLHEKLSFKDVGDSDSLNAITDNVEKMANKAYTIVDRMVDKIKDNIANKLVNFLQENTLGQFKAGFEKYADMTTSVATLSSQGYAMKRINEQLSRLNYFTDETSYNFTSMVSEIGKFTASGQSLEDATTAMMGIAEWAALSGKNANEASRAMYQLSQALGAGTMRLIDYKSIQNLNMDTIEFRKNAIEAAIAAGTLKDNLNGTFTSLIDNKTTFAIQNFAESLSGKWFNSKVMMDTYKKYSDAVDEIRAIYEEGTFTSIAGEDGKRKTSEFNTTADAVKAVKENNDLLIKKFKAANKDLTGNQIDDFLKKWKKVEKVAEMTVEDYAKIHEISEEEAKTMMEAQEKGYAEYLKEYGEVFKETEQTAEEALEDWHTYVSTYGIKAFEAAQEAKTFRDAIESAKDAASTVWTTIYTEVFGNYEEAKELWTDLANALYDIFVMRLWDIEGIFDFWKTGFEEEAQEEIDKLKEEYDKLSKQGTPLDANAQQHLAYLKKQIEEQQALLDSGLLNGRRVMFQGLYAFGSGLKGAIQNFRDAWNELFEENESAKKLFAFSERIRYDGFRFYTMMKELAESDFYHNIAQGIKNLFAPIKGAIEVIKSVINSFLPAKQTTKDILVTLSEGFKNFTEKLVPSQETLQKIARILRGFVSVIRLIAKALYGLWISIIKPVLNVVFDGLGGIFGFITDILASMADGFYGFEKTLEPLEALQIVAEAIQWALSKLMDVLQGVASVIWDIFGPAIQFVVNTLKELVGKVKSLFVGNKGDAFKNIGEGLKNVSTRAKDAWHSTESFADVFNRFKEGKGISNVVELLGELLDNLVTRIGRTIVALFGLEDVIINENGKVGEAFKDLKSALGTVGVIFKWIYTNVIRPTLQVAFTGLANCIRDIGKAWQSGDVMQIMKILTQAFKTIGSFQLFKVLQALSRTFGSAGILKVLRNAAKALKSLSRWLGAKAVNEVSSAIFKLVLAFGILLGVLTAMSFLPSENLERVSGLLLNAGIALGVMMIAMTTLSIVATKTRWGLVGIAGSMIAIVAATWTFIFVIAKIREAVQRFQDDVDGFGGILAAIAPIIAVLAGMFIVFKAAAKIGNSGGLLAFSAGIMGLGVAVFAMTFALDKMVEFMQSNTTEDVLAAIAGIIVIMLAVSLAAGLMLRIVGNSFVGIRKTSTAIAMALSIVTVALTTALIVIPLLDQMVQNSDRFPQYMQALAIFALTMISISGSFALMTSRTRGGFHMIAAGFVFNIFANTIKNIILPVLFTLADLNLDEYLGGILALGALLLVMSVGVRQLMEGIASIITALAQIKWQNWLAIILSTGAVIIGIMLLMQHLDETKTEVNIATIFVTIGIVLGIILAFSIFARTLINAVNSNSVLLDSLAKVFQWITLLITSITVGLAGTMALLKLLYDGEEMKALGRMAVYAGIVVAMIGLILLEFGVFIRLVSNRLSAIPDANLKQVRHLITTIFVGVLGIMTALLIYTVIVDNAFHDFNDYALPVFVMIGAVLLLIGGVLFEIAMFLNLLPTLQFNNSAVTIVIATLAAVLLDILAMGAVLVPAIVKIKDVKWEIILSLLAGIALIIFSISILTVAASKTATWGKTLEALIAALGVLAAIAVFLPAIASAFESMKGIGWTEFAVLLLGFLVPFVAIIVAIKVLTTVAPAFATAAGFIALAFIEIAAGIAAVALAIGFLIEMFAPGTTLLGKLLMRGEAEGIEEGNAEVIDALKRSSKKQDKAFKKTKKIRSPSKVYQEYGKMIDLGLANGITKNEKTVIKASTGLAVMTDETFCEKLGIASPSKVFYENGRFVVRGFINGMNDEANKNKQAGADMAEGFMDSFEDMKDKWSGLWSDLGMDEDIKKAIEDGTEGAGSIFANNLLDELTGGEEVVYTQLSASEQERLGVLMNKRKQKVKELSNLEHEQNIKINGEVHIEDNTDIVKENITNEIKDIDKEIESITGKAGKKYRSKGGLTGLFSSIFGDSLSNLGSDGNFLDKLKGFGGTIAGGISEVFSKDGSGFSTLLDTGKEVLSSLGFDLGGDGTNTSGTPAEATGNQISNAVGNGMNKFLTGDVFEGTMTTAGQKIGGFIKDGIEAVISKYNPFANVITMWDTFVEHVTRERREAEKNTVKIEVVGTNQEKIDALLAQNAELEKIKPANATEAAGISQKIYENNKAIARLAEEQSKYATYEFVNEDVNDVLTKILEQNPEYMTDAKAGKLEEIYKKIDANDTLTYYDKEIAKMAIKWGAGGQLNKIIDESGQNLLYTLLGSETMRAVYDDFWRGEEYSSKLASRMSSVLSMGKDFAYMDSGNNLHFTELGAGILNLEAFRSFGSVSDEEYKELWKKLGENDALGYVNTFIDTWDADEGSILDLYLSLIKDVKDESGQKSPSKVWGKIGQYDVEGYMEGFDEVFPHLLNMLVDDTALMNDTAKNGMQAMVNSLDEDIQPSITPVFDGFDTKASIGSINNAISGITPTVQATVDSFQDDTPNYNGPLSLLANQVNGLTTVVNSFMQMVADGDIITVNVNAEADPNNIYNYVIDANRRKFRQTGKNPLAY